MKKNLLKLLFYHSIIFLSLPLINLHAAKIENISSSLPIPNSNENQISSNRISPITMLLLLCMKTLDQVENTIATKETIETIHKNFDQLIKEIEAGNINLLKASFETAKISRDLLKMYLANHKVETNLSLLIILITAFCLDQLFNNGNITTILINQTEKIAKKMIYIAIKAGEGIKDLTKKILQIKIPPIPEENLAEEKNIENFTQAITVTTS